MQKHRKREEDLDTRLRFASSELDEAKMLVEVLQSKLDKSDKSLNDKKGNRDKETAERDMELKVLRAENEQLVVQRDTLHSTMRRSQMDLDVVQRENREFIVKKQKLEADNETQRQLIELKIAKITALERDIDEMEFSMLSRRPDRSVTILSIERGATCKPRLRRMRRV